MKSLADVITEAKKYEQPKPIDMILPCPSCGTLHVDAPEPDICECGHLLHQDHEYSYCSMDSCECNEFKVVWTNPPHKSHKCYGCGIIWRPADVPTNGVADTKTKGENDTWNVADRLLTVVEVD